MKRWRVWINWGGAVVWMILATPAVIFWKNSVLFVIICSLYANIKSDIGAAEAADNTEVVALLKEVLTLLRAPK